MSRSIRERSAGPRFAETVGRAEPAGVIRTVGLGDAVPEVRRDEEPAPGGRGSAGRLIVVSNRVPAPSPKGPAGAGGLAVALEAALKEKGGIWFGWSGEARTAIDADALRRQDVGPVAFATTDLTRRDVDEYYLGYANRALWPVCHYRLDLARFDERETAAFFRVNDLFARKLQPLVGPRDIVWVHDYHLMPMGADLRSRGIDNRIGFFLHIPWPPPEVASALPGYRRILQAMAAYDLIGFQTARDAENFGNCLAEEGVAKASGEGWFEAGHRRFRIAAFPISIDTDAIRTAAARSASQASVKRMAATMAGKRLVIGVDRLDYSKGLRERIRAFVTYLSHNPDKRGQVTYLQVTPKSRSEVPEYKRIEQDVAGQVGEANGACGDVDWTPIRYLNQNIPHATLTGLYRMADIGLVTPLRDGMNLVAKEYVASQDPQDPGVLVLSRYAGAADELGAALLVNPYDAVGVANAIRNGLEMPLEERCARWRSMMDVLEAHTVGDWWRGFLSTLAVDGAAAASEASGTTG